MLIICYSFKSSSAIAHLKQKFESKAKPAMQQQPPKVVLNPPLASAQPHTLGNHRTTSRLPSTAPAKITNGMQAREETDDAWRMPDFDDPGDELLFNQDPYAEQRLQLANRQRFDLENNKENIEMRPSATMPVTKKPSFIDRQTNAERVSFDESQQSGLQALPTNLGRKRIRSQVEDMDYIAEENEDEGEISDLSEDGGFEKDNRVHDIQRKRTAAPISKRSAPATTMRPPAKRMQQSQALNEDEDEDEDEDDDEEVQAAADRHNQANAPRPSQAEIYKRTNDQAKRFSATQPKKVQRRNAWSAEETEALIEYIETIGTSWVQILTADKTDGNVLQSRDQVGLKDKARNIKMDFLK